MSITVCTVIYGGESHSLMFSLFRESPPAVTSVVFREKEKGLERGVELGLAVQLVSEPSIVCEFLIHHSESKIILNLSIIFIYNFFSWHIFPFSCVHVCIHIYAWGALMSEIIQGHSSVLFIEKASHNQTKLACSQDLMSTF